MSKLASDLLEYAWLELAEGADLDRKDHPFADRSRADVEQPHLHLLRLMRNPEWFPFTCKTLLNVEILPFQHVILRELWLRPFPMLIGSRGLGKSFLLALYSVLRALFTQGSKVVIVGSAFRQSKVVFEYCEQLWAGAPVLRDLVGSGKGRGGREQGPRRDIDRCDLIIGESSVTALPMGDGQKIRGQRATHVIAEEFAAQKRPVFENVVAGFGVVSASPVQNVKEAARVKALKKAGVWTPEHEEARRLTRRANQIVISGTAYYEWNHFAGEWKRYKAIVESRGDKAKLEEIFGGEVPKEFDWRSFSVMRIPVGALPEGFMDAAQVARSKATVHSGIYLMEYGAVFTRDSDGFFRRSLVESCVTGNPESPILRPKIGEVKFHADVKGAQGVPHVFGVDPASESDRFSIVVLALHPDHRRVVYCWTTTRAAHRQKLRAGLAVEADYYAFAARRIRELMAAFPCVRIAMDAQGGGIAVEEALHDTDKLKSGELPLWRVIDPDPKKRKPTDDLAGLHLLEMVQFANAEYTSLANHGMKKDLEDKVLLFPYFDPISQAMALEHDKEAGRVVLKGGREVALYDTLEDAVLEIEELKDELATIEVTATPSGRERWDTPETKLPGARKGRLRKDRYSALLMANMAARTMERAPREPAYEAVGGWAGRRAGRDGKPRPMYVGPDWFLEGYAGARTGKAGAVVRRD